LPTGPQRSFCFQAKTGALLACNWSFNIHNLVILSTQKSPRTNEFRTFQARAGNGLLLTDGRYATRFARCAGENPLLTQLVFQVVLHLMPATEKNPSATVTQR
jgi:hypothetical protein